MAADPGRLARFRREAQVLASLNHTNIATLHGFETVGETSFLGGAKARSTTREGGRLDGSIDMVSHMKTTVNLPDALLEAARAVAAREGMTFKELLEISLHREIDRRRRSGEKPFRLDDVVAEGEGVAPGLEEGRWFELIYPTAPSSE